MDKHGKEDVHPMCLHFNVLGSAEGSFNWQDKYYSYKMPCLIQKTETFNFWIVNTGTSWSKFRYVQRGDQWVVKASACGADSTKLDQVIFYTCIVGQILT